MGRFYESGDRVQLGGIVGDVVEIGVLRTTLLECGEWVRGDQYSGRMVRIANSFVFKEPVFNYSAEFEFIWDEIMIPVKYGGDLELARQVLLQVAREAVGDYVATAEKAWRGVMDTYAVEMEPVEPRVTVAATDNWMEFTLRYAVGYRKRRSTKDRLYWRIVEELRATEGRVEIASDTLQLVGLWPPGIQKGPEA